MRIDQWLDSKKDDEFSFSVEIIPPRRGRRIEKIFDVVERLKPHGPAWINVTSHGADDIYLPNGPSFQKKTMRRSVGTFGICAVIKHKYGIEAVPHILCRGFTKQETEDALIELNYLQLENVFVVRGDKGAAHPDGNEFATDLMHQIQDLGHGRYLTEEALPLDFCTGVACYPEKNFESPNPEFDRSILMEKFSKGASYALSQMFFNTQKFIRFCNILQAKEKIIPGIRIVTKKRQISRIPGIFHVDIPQDLVRKFIINPDNENAGIEFAVQQCLQLFRAGHGHVHFYIMQDPEPLIRVLDRVRKELTP